MRTPAQTTDFPPALCENMFYEKGDGSDRLLFTIIQTIDTVLSYLQKEKEGCAVERTKVQKLAQVLRVLVIVVFVCNIVALVFVPGAVALFQDGGYETISKVIMGALDLPGYEGVGLKSVPLFFVMAVWYVWMDAYTAVLTLFLWACGICTAIILWQGKRVLDTIMKGEPFTLANAVNLRRAAVCCFIISGAALARTVWGIVYYCSIGPVLTYNALFVPVFLLAGLLCMVMSALFRQAAELKADNDLTI